MWNNVISLFLVGWGEGVEGSAPGLRRSSSLNLPSFFKSFIQGIVSSPRFLHAEGTSCLWVLGETKRDSSEWCEHRSVQGIRAGPAAQSHCLSGQRTPVTHLCLPLVACSAAEHCSSHLVFWPLCGYASLCGTWAMALGCGWKNWITELSLHMVW